MCFVVWFVVVCVCVLWLWVVFCGGVGVVFVALACRVRCGWVLVGRDGRVVWRGCRDGRVGLDGDVTVNRDVSVTGPGWWCSVRHDR